MKSRDLKAEYQRYQEMMPLQEVKVTGGKFPYRYYQNPYSENNVTLVFLAGGSGMADSIFYFSSYFTERYSLLTFHYPLDFPTNQKLADALAELLSVIGAQNVYLIGQSYGGLFAQVMAKRHPEWVKGMILSATCSLYNDLTFEGIMDIVKFMNPKKTKRNLRIDKMLPMKLIPFLMKAAFKKAAPDKETGRFLSELMELLKGSITKEYWYHMDLLLGDLMNEFGTHKPEDFTGLQNKVLIISSEADHIFSVELKDALIRLMPGPLVINDKEGGHLALLMDSEEYVRRIDTFIAARQITEP